MNWPSLTATYAAILTLIYILLGLQVVYLRWRERVAIGDGGSAALRSAIRAHSHFAEYVPIILLMAAMLEMSGLPHVRLHILMGLLLVARLLHPFGMYAKPQTWKFRICRVGGMATTTAVMVMCAINILQRALSGG